MSYLGFLAELLMSECDDRARRRSECRIKAAGFPRDKSVQLSGVAGSAGAVVTVQDVADAGRHVAPAFLGCLALADFLPQPLAVSAGHLLVHG